jgi:aromatic ring-cleaving dioxygenase
VIWSTHVHFDADDEEQAERVRQQINDLLWRRLDRPAAVSPVARVAPLVRFDEDGEVIE